MKTNTINRLARLEKQATAKQEQGNGEIEKFFTKFHQCCTQQENDEFHNLMRCDGFNRDMDALRKGGKPGEYYQKWSDFFTKLLEKYDKEMSKEAVYDRLVKTKE
jgi:hypothetical protein